MMSPKPQNADTCKMEMDNYRQIKARLPAIAENIIEHCTGDQGFSHIDLEPVASEGYVSGIIQKFQEIIFPGYFCKEILDPTNVKYSLRSTISVLYNMLAEQIIHHIRHNCLRYDLPCSHCEQSGRTKTLAAIESIPQIREVLATDVEATYDGDPAAQSYDEVIFSYPGIFTIMVHRIAHRLYELQVPMLPRIMSEYAHSITGIDIHPGAVIGPRFVIDHGTGVVIGETTKIGRNVRIYQGVTLGSLSLPAGAGKRYRGKKRHPTIEDDVIIYSGATILGGDTVIGARCVIGGNVWLTTSVPPDTKVIIEQPRLNYKFAANLEEGE